MDDLLENFGRNAAIAKLDGYATLIPPLAAADHSPCPTKKIELEVKRADFFRARAKLELLSASL